MEDIDRKFFGTVDYVIFACTLLLSSIIGIYFAYIHRKNVTSVEYLIANKSVSWLPIFISMVASFFSAVGVMGLPAKMYTTGITFGFQVFSFLFPISLCAEIFGPIFRKLELVSVNEYLELRYSLPVRYLGCFYFYLQYLLYLSIVLYAPSLALNSVADVSLPLTIVSTGLVCTFYTSLGGMRAVVWTDVFQSGVMILGLVVTAVIGVMELGSFSKIFEVGNEFKRFDVSFTLDPTEQHSFWGVVIGLSFSLMCTWTVSQPTIQRVVAAKSLKDSKKALYASFVGVLVIMSFVTLDTFVAFAMYANCDLVKSGRIKKYDEVLPYLVIDKLGHLTGLPGLFTACLFSFALSTISSGLNAMSALFLEDVLKKNRPDLPEVWHTRLSKLAAVFGGIFITCFAFVVPKLGNYVIKLALQLFGIIGGPYFSMFALGVFTKRANSSGAFLGSLTGFFVGIMFSVGQMVYPPDRNLPPISIKECAFFNATTYNTSGIIYPSDPVHREPFAKFVSVSYVWHGMIAIVTSCLVGYLVSLCTPKCGDEVKRDSRLLYDYGENWLIRRLRKQKNTEKKEVHSYDGLTELSTKF